MDLPEKISKFLTSVDRENNELYILHREDPQYLIWVKQETPIRFILVEYYDENYTPEQILAHSSLAEARKYATELLQSGFDMN
jgi:hypothetical protein